MAGTMTSPTRDRLNPKPWLALASVLLAGAVACSVEPLMPGPVGGANGGASGPRSGEGGTTGVAGTTGSGGAGAVDGGPDCGVPPQLAPCSNGRTLVVCTVDSAGRAFWMVSCPDDPTGGGGAAGTGGAAGGGGAGGAPCPSTGFCARDEVCTTEDGACHAPPGCGAGAACPAVCYGNCRPALPGNGACTRDADCRVEADYCTGCDCAALATNQSLPPCTGPGVRCLVDPCMGKTARCVNGLCAVQ
jgi:hypothetical protein